MTPILVLAANCAGVSLSPPKGGQADATADAVMNRESKSRFGVEFKESFVGGCRSAPCADCFASRRFFVRFSDAALPIA